MKPLKILSHLLLSLFALNSYANSSIEPNKLQGLVIHDDGHSVLIYGTNNFIHTEGCPLKFIVLDKSHPNYQAMYSTLLAAYHAQTSIRGWVNGCSSFGGANLTRLDLGMISY
ncbi:MAG TPA: hypothetical protein VIZ65_11085 [Cellvibrionaceae bacterium]